MACPSRRRCARRHGLRASWPECACSAARVQSRALSLYCNRVRTSFVLFFDPVLLIKLRASSPRHATAFFAAISFILRAPFHISHSNLTNFAGDAPRLSGCGQTRLAAPSVSIVQVVTHRGKK